MTEFFKDSEPFGMNFRKFHNHVYEFCQFEDVRSIQISSVVVKISELRLKTDSYVQKFR